MPPKATITKAKESSRNTIRNYIARYCTNIDSTLNLPFDVPPDLDLTKEMLLHSTTYVFKVPICNGTPNQPYPLKNHVIASHLGISRFDSRFPSANIFLYNDVCNGKPCTISVIFSNTVANLSGIKETLQVLKIVLQLQRDFRRANLPVPTFIQPMADISTTLVIDLPFQILEENIHLIAKTGFHSCFYYNPQQFPTCVSSIKPSIHSNLPISNTITKNMIASQYENTLSTRFSERNINICGGSCRTLSIYLVKLFEYIIQHSSLSRFIILPSTPRSGITSVLAAGRAPRVLGAGKHGVHTKK